MTSQWRAATLVPVSSLNSNNNNDHLAISRLFDNIYLRWEKIVFLLLFCCVSFLNRQKMVGDLPKSGITFVLFEIFLCYLAVICRYELSLSLWNFISIFLLLAKILARIFRMVFVTFCCVAFLNRQKTVGGLTKSGITYVVFEIVWWNLTTMCRYELSLSL